MGDTLSSRIRTAREEASLSREAVAAALGVSLATVVRMETGRTKRITTDTLVTIANVTGKPLSYFLGTVAA